MVDPRKDALNRWIQGTLGAAASDLEPVSGDASARRYFRLRQGTGRSLIAMDAPPQAMDSRPFVRVAGLLRDAGVNAPAVLAADVRQGFLLLSDLGTRSYLDVLSADNADALFSDALEALVHWQCATRPGVLPPYDRALLQQELDLYPEWYVARHLNTTLSPAEQQLWTQCCEALIRNALDQPRVYVHRDYMPRNLLLSTPNPGVIDFQDAVLGPVSYDVVCLFRDAFVSWEESRVAAWLGQYWSRARAAGVPVPENLDGFRRTADWMGFQRHLKVMGIFARLNYRDGKPRYLADTPRFLGYLRNVGARYADMQPLLELLNALERRGATA